jgi:protoheme IX farnesyltransferase
VLTGLGGWVYAARPALAARCSAAGGAGVQRQSAGDGNNAEDDLYAVRAGDKAARDLFAYSIAHLSLLVRRTAGRAWRRRMHSIPGLGG